VVCKVGRSALGARQSVSHTGSMTGSDAVYNAAFAQSGERFERARGIAAGHVKLSIAIETPK
jgi:succinyl-CoA ligase-like protein